MQEIIARALADLPEEVTASYAKPYKIWRAPGCTVCKGKGIQGRAAIFEVLRMTPQLEEIIVSGSTIQKIGQEAKRQGMITLRQDGIIKVLEGLLPLEEVLRETEE
jgi:type IV pilus assembly protein PilB